MARPVPWKVSLAGGTVAGMAIGGFVIAPEHNFPRPVVDPILLEADMVTSPAPIEQPVAASAPLTQGPGAEIDEEVSAGALAGGPPVTSAPAPPVLVDDRGADGERLEPNAGGRGPVAAPELVPTAPPADAEPAAELAEVAAPGDAAVSVDTPETWPHTITPIIPTLEPPDTPASPLDDSDEVESVD